MSRGTTRGRRTLQELSRLLALMILLAPLSAYIHFASEPHIFCPVHHRFEDVPVSVTPGERGVPASPSSSEEVELVCPFGVIIQASFLQEEGLAVVSEPMPVCESAPPAVVEPVRTFTCLVVAPKHSPPLPAV